MSYACRRLSISGALGLLMTSAAGEYETREAHDPIAHSNCLRLGTAANDSLDMDKSNSGARRVHL